MNLFHDLPAQRAEEQFTTLLQARQVRIERIVSRGQASPPDFWYDQQEHEWVLVLEGAAAVQFEGQPEPVQLERGACLNIPAHVRHRVAWTDPHRPTVWLAVHYTD